MQNNQGVNKIILVGHIDKAPRNHHLQADRHLCTLSFPLITTEKISRNGTDVSVEECHQVKISGRSSDIDADRFVKGTMMFIEGRIKTRVTIDNEGIKRFKTEIWATRYETLN